MKMDMMPGEWAFKCLYKRNSSWALSEEYYFTLEEAQAVYGSAKWPVEITDNGSIYIPAKDEYNG